jgi:hypothetical protein
VDYQLPGRLIFIGIKLHNVDTNGQLLGVNYEVAIITSCGIDNFTKGIVKGQFGS